MIIHYLLEDFKKTYEQEYWSAVACITTVLTLIDQNVFC